MRTGSLSLAVWVSEIPATGRRFRIEASEDERRRLAEELGIVEVAELSAELDLRPLAGGAFSLRGALSATVVQTDVVTLEPVRQPVQEAVDLTLVAAEDAPPRPEQSGAEPAEDDGPEHFENGRIELGALVGEHLALGLDPYPREPGIEFAPHIEDDSAAAASPFAVLGKLKKDEG